MAAALVVAAAADRRPRTRSSRPTTSACTAWTPTSRCSRSCRPTTSSTRRWSAPTPGASPRCVDDSAVTLSYSAIADANGSINTRSVGKTNFWLYAAQPTARTSPRARASRACTCRPTRPARSRRVHLERRERHVQGRGHPDHADRRRRPRNRYPLMRMTATDKSSARASRRSTSCCPSPRRRPARDCHATGGRRREAARITWSANARPRGAVARERAAAARQPHGHAADGVEASALRGLPLLRRARPRGHRPERAHSRQADDVGRHARLSRRQDADGRGLPLADTWSRRAARRRRPRPRPATCAIPARPRSACAAR